MSFRFLLCCSRPADDSRSCPAVIRTLFSMTSPDLCIFMVKAVLDRPQVLCSDPHQPISARRHVCDENTAFNSTNHHSVFKIHCLPHKHQDRRYNYGCYRIFLYFIRSFISREQTGSVVVSDQTSYWTALRN